MKTALSRPVLLALVASLLFTPMGRGDAPTPAPASPQATTEQEIVQRLEGKFVYLRGFYQDNKIEFDVNGKAVGNPQKGSFTLSALQIRKVHATKKTVVIEADRYGLHFFGGLPYEDDTKPFEKIKVSKKPIEITIARLVIEPEKKKKNKKNDAKKDGTAPAKPGASAADAAKADDDDDSDAPAVAQTGVTAGTTAAAPANAAMTAPPAAGATPAAVEPGHPDPRLSWMQLSKALDQIFANDLDDSVIATLPSYWQNYFANKAGRQKAQQADNAILHPGNGVVAPKLMSSLDPASNDYAQKNGIAGMILLSTVVGPSGQPGNISIVRPIGFGLDESAVAAVERAKFRPGLHEGQPAPVEVNLQVMFRIYSNLTRPKPGEAQPSAPPETPASAPPPTHGNGNGKEVAEMQ